MIFYAYFGYPLCLLIISVFKRPINSEFIELLAMNYELPPASFIITAYNEESRITEKIEGSLSQDYPKEKLEIIIASDCSSDSTDEIVKSYEDKGVKLVRAPERKGKENAQKHAVEASTGDILVFSDVATILKPDGIFNTLLNSIRLGLRGVSDSSSLGYYKNISDEKKEFNRKVRTVLRGISVLMRNLGLLNPGKYRLFSWQLFSHKFCRWLVPFFLIIAFVSNAVIAFSSVLYFFTFFLQIAFYFLAYNYYSNSITSSELNYGSCCMLCFYN